MDEWQSRLSTRLIYFYFTHVILELVITISAIVVTTEGCIYLL